MEITLDIDDAVMAELEQQAAGQGRTLSEIVEEALRSFLCAPEELKPPLSPGAENSGEIAP
jgi:predicted transcriptional regulator